MSRLLTWVLAAAIITGASSCKLWRRISGRSRPADTTGIVSIPDTALIRPDTAIVLKDTTLQPPPLPDSASAALLQSWAPLWTARMEWETFNGRSELAYSGGGESHDLQVSIRMERDQRIWVSVTALLGIEVVRALITPDTITIINRRQKEVRSISFDEAGALLPAATNFPTLQSLILGEVLPSGVPLTDVGEIGDAWTLHAISDSLSHEAGFSKADSTLQLQVLTSAATSLRGVYIDYEVNNGRRFSMRRELSINDGGSMHQINMRFSKAVFDEPVEMNFPIPAKYERR